MFSVCFKAVYHLPSARGSPDCTDLGYCCPQEIKALWPALDPQQILWPGPLVSCLVFPAMFFSWIPSLSTPLLIIHRPLHLSLVGPEVWGDERVGARGVGACPCLVMCCAGFSVGTEYIHSTVSGKQAACAERLPFSSALQGRKQEKPWEQLSLEVPDKLQLSPPGSPHTSSPENSSEEEDSRNNSPALGLSPPQGLEAANSPCSRSPEEEKEEEDELKYVREIFFS